MQSASTRKSTYQADRKFFYTEEEGSEVYWLSSLRKDTAANCMRMTKKKFFWYFRQHGNVVCYQRFGTAYRSQKTAWPLQMGPIGCPKTSLTNDQSTLCRRHLHRGGSLKSRKKTVSHWASNWKMMEQIRM